MKPIVFAATKTDTELAKEHENYKVEFIVDLYLEDIFSFRSSCRRASVVKKDTLFHRKHGPAKAEVESSS